MPKPQSNSTLLVVKEVLESSGILKSFQFTVDSRNGETARPTSRKILSADGSLPYI